MGKETEQALLEASSRHMRACCRIGAGTCIAQTSAGQGAQRQEQRDGMRGATVVRCPCVCARVSPATQCAVPCATHAGAEAEGGRDTMKVVLSCGRACPLRPPAQGAQRCHGVLRLAVGGQRAPPRTRDTLDVPQDTHTHRSGVGMRGGRSCRQAVHRPPTLSARSGPAAAWQPARQLPARHPRSRRYHQHALCPQQPKSP